jgi:hypothetical protein
VTDNPNKRGKQDRALIASKQPYEVHYFARKWGLTASEARSIIKAHGPSRKACNEAAAHGQAKRT